jgi:hypothetical protein
MRLRAIRGRLAALGAVLLLSLLSCGREITGPGGGIRFARGLSFVAEFPGHFANVESGAGSVVSFNRVQVLFRRLDGSTALERVLPFGASQTAIEASFDIPLSSEASSDGEALELLLRYINAEGDTVFAGGPTSVFAAPARRGQTPQPIEVELEYTGPGADAVSVEITPDTIALVAGAPFSFTTIARDIDGNPVPAPIVHSSLDPQRATVPAVGLAEGVTLATRGEARIRAALAAGGAEAIGILQIAPAPGSLARVGTETLTAPAGATLPDSVRVRLLATDGLPLAGAALELTVNDGGSVSDSLPVTDEQGVVALAWTLGPVAGSQSLGFALPGVTPLTVSATATASTATATQLAIVNQSDIPQTSGQPFEPPVQVEAQDSTGAVVPAFTGIVTLELVESPAESALSGTLSVAAVNGVAAFNTVLADRTGAYRLRAVSPGLLPDTSLIYLVEPGVPDTTVVIEGNGQVARVGEPLSEPIVVMLLDAAGNRVPGSSIEYSVTTGGGSVVGMTTTTDSLGLATIGTWTLGPEVGEQTLTVFIEGGPQTQVVATAEPLAPIIELSVVGSSLIGFERDGLLNVRLLQPAPAGGITVSVTSDAPQILTINEPGTVSIAAGDTLGSIGVFGVAVGIAQVRADAEGYTSDTLAVEVSLNLISLPPSLNVPLALTASLPITISAPAPAGGVAVTVTAVDPSIARPVQDVVTIPAGSQTASVAIEGLTIGTTSIGATNPNYAFDATTVNVTAGVDIVNPSYTINASFGEGIVVRLVSGGSPVAAPAGGITIDLASDAPACAGLPASATIPAGLTSVTANLTYGGSATLPCTTRVRAFGPEGFSPDSANVTVNVQPQAGLATAMNLGSGLQRNSTLSLGASNHGGTTVRLQSADPTIALVSPNVSTPGSAFIDVPILIGGATASFHVQAVEGRLADTTFIYASAPGFVTDSMQINVWQGVYEIIGLNANATTISADDAFQVRVGTPSNPTTGGLTSVDALRAGADTLRVSVISDSGAVGTLVTSGTIADSVEVPLRPQATATPGTVAAGGVAFRALGQGTTTVRSVLSGFRALPNSTGTVAISQPSITSLSTLNVGSGLQRTASIGLSQVAVDTVNVRLHFDRTGSALLSDAAGTVGVDTLVVSIPPGSSTRTFFVQGLEGRMADTLTLSASADGFTGRTSVVRVFQAVYEIIGLNASGTTLSVDDAFQVRVGTPSSPTTGLSSIDPIRAGGTPLAVNVVNDSVGIGTLVVTAGTTDSTTLTIPVAASITPGTVAGGGVAFRYLSQGVATLRADIQGLRAAGSALGSNVTITSPSISGLTSMDLGSGLQRSGTVSLSQAAQDTVRLLLTFDSLGRAVVAPNATALGSDSLEVVILPGGSSAGFTIQALEGFLADTVTLVASAPGFIGRTSAIRIWQPVQEILTFNTSMTSLDADVLLRVRIGSPSSATGTISSLDPLRIGSPGVTVRIASSAPTVGRMVVAAGPVDTAIVNIAAGQNITPTTLALGGFAFDPLTTGQTVVTSSAAGFRAIATSSRTVTVIPPALTISTANATVGAGLQISNNGTINTNNHGGMSIWVVSSNPSILRVAPNTSTVASDSALITVNPGATGFSFISAGVEGTTGAVSVTARAAGFLDGAQSRAVAAPAVRVNTTLATTGTAGVTADDPFTVTVGLPNGTLTELSSIQSVRAGSNLAVLLTSSDSTVGALVSGEPPVAAGTATVTIVGGQSSSPSSVTAGGVAFRFLAPGTTSVIATPSGTGFVTMANSQRTVTVSSP